MGLAAERGRGFGWATRGERAIAYNLGLTLVAASEVDQVKSPPPPEAQAQKPDTEADKQADNRTAVSKKKAWSKPTIVRSSDGMALFEGGPQPDTAVEDSVYFIMST